MRRPDTPENRSARPESALLLGRMPCGSVAQTTRATPLGRACRSAKPDEFEPASPAEEAGEAAKVVRTMARNLREGREFSVTEQHQELVAAVRELAQVLNAGPRSGDVSSFVNARTEKFARSAAGRELSEHQPL